MSDKYKNDQIALEEIKKVTGGFSPEAYFHAESGFNYGVLNFLIGPIFGSLLSLIVGKKYLVALARDHVYLINTNGECKKFNGDHIKFHKSEIVEATCKKKRKLHNLQIKLQGGKTYKLEASEGFIYLKDRLENIGKFENFLGITH